MLPHKGGLLRGSRPQYHSKQEERIQSVTIMNMLDREQQIMRLFDVAKEVVDKFGDSRNHTVAAAVLANDGKMYTGLNLFHFTGGPCAEIVVLAAAISDGNKELLTLIAVGNNDRGVLAPCGRCRQVIFDYYPNMNVVTGSGQDLVLASISDLLPNTYDWGKQQVNDKG